MVCLAICSLAIGNLDNLIRTGDDACVAPMILRATAPWSLVAEAVAPMRSAYTGRPEYSRGVYDKEERLGACLDSDPSASIAYFFDPDSWVHWIATGSVTAFGSDCFYRFGFKQLSFYRFRDNPAPGRVYARGALK